MIARASSTISRMTDTERTNFTDHCDQFTDGHERITEPSDFSACLFLTILPYKNAVPVLICSLLVLTIFSFLINGFVLFGASLSDDISEQPRAAILKNLILSDILQISNFGPTVIHSLSQRRTITFNFWCNVQYFVGTVSIFASLVTISFMAFERYLYVCHAIHYLVILNQMRLRLALGLTWFYALSITTIYILLLYIGRAHNVQQVTNGLLCEPDIMEQIFGFPRAAAIFRKVTGALSVFLCLMIYAFSYVRMYRDASNAVIPFNAVNTTARKTVLFYCGMLLLQLLPLLLKVSSDALWEIEGTVAMSAQSSPQSVPKLNLTPSVTATVLHMSLLLMLLVPPTINPLVYGLRNAEIRHALCKLIRWRWWGRRRDDWNQGN